MQFCLEPDDAEVSERDCAEDEVDKEGGRA